MDYFDGAPSAAPDDDAVHEARKFLAERESAESEIRADFAADLRFAYVEGAQWDEKAKAARRGRPCYTYNRVAGAINQLIGDQRMTQPSGKVRAINRKGSAQVAEIFAGLCRDIEARSAADSTYADAFKYCVAGSWGAWRVVPEYADDESFDQVLSVKRIPNPLTVYFDEQADPHGRGAMKCLVTERIARDKYEALYGDVPTDVPASRDADGWFGPDEVRIAEYYRRLCRTKHLARLSDGRTVEKTEQLEAELARLAEAVAAAGTDSEAPHIVEEREVKEWYVEWLKVDGARVLEGPIEYSYRHIPVVRVPGRHVNVEGRQQYQSLIRHSKDAARTYNYNRSNMVESVALSPRAPYIATARMVKGRENQWASANVGNPALLLYDVDPAAPQAAPSRNAPPDVPQAYIALAMHDAEDIRQTTGYFNPALDQQTAAGDAESGRALRTRLNSADTGSYEFLDNFAKSIKYTWEIMIDMIPVHYDTERVERIIGDDGRESFQAISPELLRRGKYDVTVTLGPAYATARMESLEKLLEAAERMPIIAEVAPDVIVANMDVRGADEIERRVRQRLIHQGIVQPTEAEQAQGITPPPPDPVQQALQRRLEAQAARDEASAQKTGLETQAAAAGVEHANQREYIELAQMIADLVHQRVETQLARQVLERESQDRLNVNV